MRNLARPIVAVTCLLSIGSQVLAGWCQACTWGCNFTPGSVRQGAGGDFPGGNRFDHEVISSNPHYDCSNGGLNT
jgi:hypothetical protein